MTQYLEWFGISKHGQFYSPCYLSTIQVIHFLWWIECCKLSVTLFCKVIINITVNCKRAQRVPVSNTKPCRFYLLCKTLPVLKIQFICVIILVYAVHSHSSNVTWMQTHPPAELDVCLKNQFNHLHMQMLYQLKHILKSSELVAPQWMPILLLMFYFIKIGQ